MISNALFLLNTLACFLGLQAVTLIIIMLKRQDSGTTQSLKAARNFIIVSVILGSFYYLTYYREFVWHHFETSAFLRALDASVFYAMGCSWVLLIDALIESPHPKMIWWRKHTKKVFITLMILSALLYVFLLDEYYSTTSLAAEITVIIAELVLGIVLTVYILAYVILGYRYFNDKFGRIYIIAVSLLVCFTTIWNSCVVISVYIKGMAQVFNVTNLYGTTSIMLLVIDFFSLLYFYRRDFSPIYFGERDAEEKQPEIRTEEETLDWVARTCRLTEREREVLVLAYQGLSNPDIAEALYISRHTVKRHMHNIFEKLNVSTRMELAHLIQSQMQPDHHSSLKYTS